MFRFSGADNASTVTFECRMDSTIEADFAPCVEPGDVHARAGSHTFQVRAQDISGNVDGTPASYTWTIVAATGGPTVTIDSGPDAATVDTSATFEFSANRSTVDLPVLAHAVRTSTRSRSACTSPKTYTGSTPGNWVFRVRASTAPTATPTPRSASGRSARRRSRRP